MNVLLTAAGRRAYLVHYFREALAGQQGVVVAANSVREAPAMAVADNAVVVPPSHHNEYPDAIAEVCRNFDIGLLCSCHDLDVLALSPYRERLHALGVVSTLPSEEWANLCLDKYECGEQLRKSGFPTPWATLSVAETIAALRSGEISLPVVIKARLGFGSSALHVCRSLDELQRLFDIATNEMQSDVSNKFVSIPPESRVLIQQFIQGAEQRLNIVNDLGGHYAAHFACHVHEMRAGESDRATTIDATDLSDFSRRFSALTQHVGIWGIDYLVDRDSRYIIDINPRFAGEYPFFHLAGANIPAALFAWVEGRQPESSWFKPAVGVRGYKDLVPRKY